MPDIRVDPDQLTTLAGRLQQIKQALQDAQQDASGYDGALGPGNAAGSLSSFISGWSHGRQEICDGIDSCHKALAGAGQSYSRQEAALAKGFKPKGGSGTGGGG